MSKTTPSTFTSICSSCLKRLRTSPLLPPPYIPVRGKKTKHKPVQTIKVQLLRDVQGYGRAGSIVPVAPGLFRNYWLPKRWASYLSASASKPKDIVAERDFSFGAHSKATPTPSNDQSQANAPQERKESNKPVTTAAARAVLVSPERATEILDQKLPAQILFYRVPISEPSPTIGTTPSPDTATEQWRQHASPAAAALAAASSPTLPPVNVGDSLRAEPIFGSVSTSDIADSIKALLAQDEEGARIVLSAEDVTILTGEGVEGEDRVKALGEFPIEVKVRGGRDTVRRSVFVTAVEDEN